MIHAQLYILVCDNNVLCFVIVDLKTVNLLSETFKPVKLLNQQSEKYRSLKKLYIQPNTKYTL